MKTLHFQQIADSRFNTGLPDLELRISQITSKLSDLPGVTVKVDEPYRIDWGEPDPNTQYRANFYVTKDKRVTWDTIYALVNSVKPVYYRFIY